MRTLTIGASLVAARLRTGRTTALTVATVVLVTAFIFTSAPVAFDRAAQAGLQDAVASASAVQRNLEFSLDDRVPPGEDDPLGGIVARGQELGAVLPPSMAGAVEEPTFLVESVEHLVLDAPAPISRLTLRYQSGIDDQIRIVEGRAPGDTIRTVDVPGTQTESSGPFGALLVEVALSRQTAETLQVDLGQRLLMSPGEGIDPGLPAFAAVDVVGIFELIDPSAEYWLQDLALARPSVERVTINSSIFRATALFSPGAYPAIHARLTPNFLALPLRYAWRFLIDPNGLDASTVDTLAGDLTRLQAVYPFRGTTLDSDAPSLRTGLSTIVEGYRAQRRTAEVALSVAALGPAGASAAALGLVCLLLARRRREAVSLVHDRGASRLQVLTGQVVEGLVLSAPPAAVGYLLAVLVSGGDLVTPLPAVLVVLGTVVLLMTAADPLARGAALPDERQRAASAGVRPQRLVFEILLVIVAVVGAVSLLDRGLGRGGGSSASATVDPYLAAVPLLIGLAAGVIVSRVYPLPMRLLAFTAAMRRGLVPALALRNASRGVGTARLPLLVLLLVTAMGVFSSVLLTSIERGQQTSAWLETGADYRVEVGPGSALPETFAAANTPSAEAVAQGVLSEARFDGGSSLRTAVRLMALDVASYARVTGRTPAAIRFPSEMMMGSWQSGVAGSEEDPIPAVVSVALAARSGLGAGDTFQGSLGGVGATFRIAALIDRFPGMGTVSGFFIAPRDAVAVAFPLRDHATTVAYIRGPAELDDALREQLQAHLGEVRIVSRAERYAVLHDAPLVSAVTSGFGGALAIALVYSALAMAAGLTLALGARRPQLALLRTLGLKRRQMMGLILLEQAPMVIVALLGGIGLGLGISGLLSPGLGLGSFTGDLGAFDLTMDPLAILLLGVAPVVVVAAAVLGGAWLIGRSDLARATRMGDTT